MKALSTLIMATVVTKIGRLNTEAREEFSRPMTRAAPMQVRNISSRLPVALYTMAPSSALTPVAAPRLMSKLPSV